MLNFKIKGVAVFIAACLMSSLLMVNQPLTVGHPQREEQEKRIPEISLVGEGGFQRGIFFGPTYLAIQQQRLYVSDTMNNRVQAFIRGNVFQLAFGGFGQNDREFDGVAGIGTNDQNLFVVDSANARIQVFTSQGDFVKEFGRFGQNDGEFEFPTDIAVSENRLYVLDTGNHRVQIFNHDGNHINTFGKLGNADGEFNFPLGIATFEDKVFVADTRNHRIQIFDNDGIYLSKFGWKGTEDKAFQEPIGLSFDDGSLYVVDSGNKRVQIFTPEGNYKDKLTYEGFVEPYDIGFLENRIIVSDKGAHRVFVFEQNGRFHGIYGVNESPQGRFIRPVSVTASSRQVFVLDEIVQNIQVFNENNEFVSAFSNEEMQKADIKKLISIEYHDAKIYAVDSVGSKIAIFSQDGRFLSSFGSFGSLQGQMVLPSDISIDDGKLFVADAGNSRVQVFTLDGEYLHHFGSFGRNDGQFIAMSGITAGNQSIYVADTGNNRIQEFDYEGNFIRRIGRRGLEIGSYFGLKGIFIDPANKLYVADTMNNRIQVTDMLTEETTVFGQFGAFSQHERSKIRGNETFGYDDLELMGSFLYPMDIAIFQDQVLVADAYNHRVKSIKMSEIFGTKMMRLTPSYLDFGSIDSQNEIERSFLIHNESGNIMSGSVSSDHPAVIVEPRTFSAPYQKVRVRISGDQLEQGNEYEATISVALDNDYNTKQDVKIQFRGDETPDFYADIDPIVVASADDAIVIPIRVEPQNGFRGRISFIALGMPRNTTSEFSPTSILVEEDQTYHAELRLSPSARMIEAGFYNIEVEAQAARGGIRRRATSTFVFQQRSHLVPHTVLGELFTAIWCINCVHSHYAMNRLYYELGKEKVVWLEYYVMSEGRDEPSPRLTSPDSESRMFWYQADYGLPTIYFNGTDYLKGVPTGEDTRTFEGRDRAMYNGYRARVMEHLKKSSIVSIGVHNFYDSQTQTGKISATVRALDSIPFRDPRIYFVLTETDIPFSAINGEEEHHFVVRDMLTPKNDDINDYLGTPMKLPNGETFNRKGDVYQLEVDYEILDFYNLSKMSLVVFVQDNVTKTVLQAAELPVKTINNSAFNLISDHSLNQLRTKGEQAVITTHLVNTGTKTETFDLRVLNRSQDKWLFSVYVDGKEVSATGTSGLRLQSFDMSKVEIRTTVPPNAEQNDQQLFTIEAFSRSSQRTQNLSGKIEVVEARPPDFILSVDALQDERIMAGESISYQINVTPDPYFDDEISLNLRDIPDDIESVEFEPVSGIVPFSSVLTINIKPETPDREMVLDIIASGGEVSHTQRISFRVERNPDALPPLLEMAYPPDGMITNQKILEVSGRTDPTAMLTINEEMVDIESSGMFAHEITLEEGPNALTLVATNRVGLQTEVIRTVMLDTVPPVIELKPIPEEVMQSTIVIEGRTDPGAIVTIEAQDVAVDEEGNFSHPFDLVHGFNSIEIIAIDQATNSSVEYIEVSLITLIKLQIGSTSAYINHEEFALDAPPYIKAGRTMVPLRFIGEALGAEVEWDGNLRQITLVRDGRTIRMVIGSTEVFIGEEGRIGETKYTLDAPPEIVEGRTFVPIRFISEAFGAEVEWVAETREIKIKN